MLNIGSTRWELQHTYTKDSALRRSTLTTYIALPTSSLVPRQRHRVRSPPKDMQTTTWKTIALLKDLKLHRSWNQTSLKLHIPFQCHHQMKQLVTSRIQSALQ